MSQVRGRLLTSLCITQRHGSCWQVFGVAVSAGSARCVPCSPPPQGPQEALLCVQVLRKARAGVHILLLCQEMHPSRALQIPEDSLSAQPGGDLANAVLQQGLSAAPGLPTALLGAGHGSVQKGMS